MGRISGTNYETGALANPVNTGTQAVKQQAAQQPNSPLGGLWNDVTGAVGNVFNGAINSFKNGWSWFADHESRPGKAVETVLDKMVGGQTGQKTSWMDVFKGLTLQKSLDVTGQTLVSDAATQVGKMFDKSLPDQASWQYKIPAFIGGLAADVVTDPFMYVGLGEGADLGKAVLGSDGAKLGYLTDEGISAIKDILKVDDLSKVGSDGVTLAKTQIANRFISGEKGLLSEPSVARFMGKTILSSDQWDEVVGRVKANSAYKFIADSAPMQTMKNWGNTLFNPKWVSGVAREMPEEFYKNLQGLFRGNSLDKLKALDGGISGFGFDAADENLKIAPEVQEQLFKLANGEGALAADGSGTLLKRADLAGKTFAESRALVDPSVSDDALKGYMKYINETLPSVEARKTALGMNFEGLNDHIKNYYPELSKYTEARGMISKPLKDLTAGFQKSRVSDEDMARAFWDATGMDKATIDATIEGSTPTTIKKAADSYRAIAGLSRDPFLNLAKDLSELGVKENTSKFIGDTLEKYGTKISPDEVKQYQSMGYGIYYPKGNLRFYPLEEGGAGVAKGTAYAFENPAISNTLNSFSTDIKQNFIHKALSKLSSSIVNLYFYNPATVLYHSIHNVAYNTWLADGIDAFDNVSKGAQDVVERSDMYQRALRAGALRPEADARVSGTLKEGVDEMLNRTEPMGTLKNIANHLNPLGRNHYMNQVFNGSDNALRMNLFRNSLQTGSTDAEAADFVNHFAGNNADLSEVEKQGFRTAYPYYSWFKTNVKANFGAWLNTPARQLIPVKTWNALNEALSGREMWQNGPGSDFKIATGQKDPKTGRMIYVNPSFAGNIVPEFVENPLGFLVQRMSSGPLENIVSSLTMGKDTYEALNNVTTPESMPGAPASAKVMKALTQVMPFDNAKDLMTGNANFLKTTLSWDTTHPLWRNIMDAIIQAYTSTPLPQKQLESIQKSDVLKYQKSVRKRARMQ